MRYEIEGKLLSDIGDAIREKTGKSELILPGDMPGEIEGIKSKPILQDKTVTENGPVMADSGYDGLGSVYVNVIENNLLNYHAFKTVNIVNGIAKFESNGRIIITARNNDAYTDHTDGAFPYGARIPVASGQTVTMTWNHEGGNGYSYLFQEGKTSLFRNVRNPIGKIVLTATKDTYFTFRFGVDVEGDVATFSNIRITRNDPV